MNATGAAQGAAGAATPEMVRRLVQGSVLHLSAQLFLTLCTYVVAVVLARSLGPAAFGIYGIVYSLLMTTEFVGRFGIPQASGKLMAELPAQHDRIAASGLTISLSAYLVLFAGMWLAAPAIAAIFGIPEGAGLLRLAFWDIPIYGAFFVLWHILNARRRFLIESTSFVLYALTKVVGISILVWIGPTLRDAFIVNIASSLVAALFIGWFVGRMPWRFSLAESRRIMQLAMPIGILTVGLQLLPTIDLWMLSAIGNYSDDAVLGYYVAALSIARIPNFISNGLNAALGHLDRQCDGGGRPRRGPACHGADGALPAGGAAARRRADRGQRPRDPDPPVLARVRARSTAVGHPRLRAGRVHDQLRHAVVDHDRRSPGQDRQPPGNGAGAGRHSVQPGRRVAVRRHRRSGGEPLVVRDRSRRCRSYFSGASTARSHGPVRCCALSCATLASRWCRRTSRRRVCGCWSSSSSSASSTWQRCRCSALSAGATSRCFAAARLRARVGQGCGAEAGEG